MTMGRDAAMLLSRAIEGHFMAFWLTGLVLAVWWAFARRSASAVQALIPYRTRRATPADYLAIAAFAVFLSCYIFVIFYRADFAGQDHSQLTLPIMRNSGISAGIWTASGRFWPFGNQEFDVLQHVAPSPAGYLTFSTLQLLFLLGTVFVFLRGFSITARLLILALLLLTPSWYSAFSGLIYPERNVLVLMAILALSLQWYDARPSTWLAACALVTTHVMLYFKEPVFAFVLALAGARVLLRWRNMPPDRRTVRSLLASSPVDVGMVLLALGFLALYFGTMLPYRSMGYAEHHATRATPAAAFLWYLLEDPLLIVFITAAVFRLVRLAGARRWPDMLVDPLALGGLCYWAVYVALGMRAHYYMAPVDLIAVLFLAEVARMGVAEGRLRVGVPAAAGVAVAIPLLLATWFWVVRNKNFAGGRLALVEYVKRTADTARVPVRLFIAGQSPYAMMEFGSLLLYKGVRLVADSAARERPGVVVMEGPFPFEGQLCVAYRRLPCHRASAPAPGSLVLTLPDDRLPDGVISLRPSDPAFVYQPFWIPAWFPLIRATRSRLTGSYLKRRQDWMWAYAEVVPERAGLSE